MKKILFLGNSFTYFNEMPLIFENLVKSAGLEVKVGSVTKGGYTLRRYLDKSDCMCEKFYNTFDSDSWDYIVLQEQSKRPAVDEEEFASAAHEICELAKSKGCMPVFYQTWSYRNGSEKLAATGYSYAGLYQSLKEAYQRAAQKDGAEIVHVGDSFYNLSLQYPQIDLLMGDDYHPNIYGSYLIAIMFLYHFFGTDTPVNYRPQEISEQDAKIIIKVIKEVV
jgi:hypothetical protein